MRTMILATMFVLLCAGTAAAQVDTTPNGIGIYADMEGMTNQVDLDVGQPLEVYLLLTNPTGPSKLGGWECSLGIPGNVTIWGWNHPHPGTMTFAEPPQFMSVFTPIPYGTVCHLMTFILVPLDSEPAVFTIGPCEIGSQHPEAPRYLDVDYDAGISGTLINLVPYCSGPDQAAFVVNGGSVPTEDAVWGEVKALYR